MSLWIIIGAFCFNVAGEGIECSTMVIDRQKFTSKAVCEKRLLKGEKHQCIEASVVNMVKRQ